MITGTQLDRFLRYDAKNGALFWKRGRGGQPAGSRAGHIQKFTQPNGTIRFYRMIRIFGRLMGEHVLIFIFETGRWPSQEIDHRNGQTLENIFENLREATHRQNCHNTKRRSDNTSGFKGVSWDSINEKWVARIRVPNGKYENLGRFDSEKAAHAAYFRRAKELFGDFARAA